jgi:hypothetical protein
LSRPELASWFVVAVAFGEAPLTLAWLRGEQVADVVHLEEE